MIDWSIAIPSFLTALVEWVEAFTIVLAVSLSIGWRSAIGASLAGLATLALLTLVAGRLLLTGLDVRWLAKAIARHAGLKPLHDETLEFEHTRSRLSGDWVANWMVAYKGVLLEGLEVWLVVVALGMKTSGSQGLVSSGGAALAALLLTCAVGAAVRAPLQRVPENGIKFTVGAMIVAFGTYWTMEGAGGSEIWPLSDWTLLILGVFYLLAGLAVATVMRMRVRQEVA